MNTTVLKGIVLTEKAAFLGGGRVYSFLVDDSANKHDIANAIKAKYDVMPIKVNVVRTATRSAQVRGRSRTIRGQKKALVTLPEGKSIDFT